ncbi:MAG TPA: type VI secretion system tube protein Hcp [Longimicrobiales bacterium]|nr:type VI secretion system tube protein Hcp [Longimicrobiales bacterium]
MAFDAFLTIDGVESESTREGFEGQIELLSFHMGASNPSSTVGAGAGAGKAVLSSFNCTKVTDKASPGLFQACCQGKHYPKAKVTLHKAGGDKAVDYLVYEFDKVFVESIDWSGASGGDDRPVEQLSLAYGKVTVTYTPQTEKGAKGSPVVGSWDKMKVKA